MTEEEKRIFVHNVQGHKYPIVFVFPNEREEECNDIQKQINETGINK